MSDHVWTQENLDAYLAGGLDANDRALMERHLAECRECTDALTKRRKLEAVFHVLFADAPPHVNLEDRAIARLRRQPASMHLWVRYVMAAAAVLVLGFVGAIAQAVVSGDGLKQTAFAWNDSLAERTEHGKLKDVDFKRKATFSTVDTDPAAVEFDQNINYMTERVGEVSVPGNVSPSDSINGVTKEAAFRTTRTDNKEFAESMKPPVPRVGGEVADPGIAILRGNNQADLNAAMEALRQKDLTSPPDLSQQVGALGQPMAPSNQRRTPGGFAGGGSSAFGGFGGPNTFGSRGPDGTWAALPSKHKPNAYSSINDVTSGSGASPYYRSGEGRNDPTGGEQAQRSQTEGEKASKGPIERKQLQGIVEEIEKKGNDPYALNIKPGDDNKKPAYFVEGGDQGKDKTAQTPPPSKKEPPPPPVENPKPADPQKAKPPEEAQPEPEQKPGRKIIRTGEIEFETESFDKAAEIISKIIDAVKGRSAFVATTNSDKLPNGKMKGSIVVRMPPEHLDKFITDLRKALARQVNSRASASAASMSPSSTPTLKADCVPRARRKSGSLTSSRPTRER